MVDSVKTGFPGRINQYVSYRRQVASGGKKFAEELSRTESSGDLFADAQNDINDVQRDSHIRRNDNTGRNSRSNPQINNSKRHITVTQAERLAKYAPVIQEASQKYNVPVELVCAVILQESGGNAKAVSHCGAKGLMQLMPATAKRLGVRNSFDPVDNIMGGTKYLRMLLDEFDGNLALAIAGYNAGEGNVAKYGNKIPPFRETQAYVPGVLKYADTMWSILKQPVRRVEVQPPQIFHRTIYRA